MTNYEMIKSHYPASDCTILGKCARELCDLRNKLLREAKLSESDISVEQWLFRPADTALFFKPGDFVKIKAEVYGVVLSVDYRRDNDYRIFELVKCVTSHGCTTAVYACDVTMSDLPYEILSLARNAIKLEMGLDSDDGLGNCLDKGSDK